MRKIINWNEDWRFFKGEKTEADKWEKVTLPHTWNAIDGQDGGNDYYQGAGWYEKTFCLDAVPAKAYIRFEGVNKLAEVWCNGEYIGEHRGGFSTFTLDITRCLECGENEISVKADNGKELEIYPHFADFTFFGGIYRDVQLICFDDEIHFDTEKFGSDAILITPNADTGEVTAELFTTGDGEIVAEIFDGEGKLVTKGEAVCGSAVKMQLNVADVHRWNGIEDPYLYRFVAKLYRDDKQLDEISANFGFRTFSVSPDSGFYLNGQPYRLRGVCRHQDREDMGWALTEKEHLEDMKIISEMGANTIRLAHYQHAQYFYDLCDKYGMVAWAEIPFISMHDTREGADDNLKLQMHELVMQNYNHPSICFWGVANEIGMGGETEAMYDITRELHELTKKLDSTRPTVIANVGLTQTNSPLFHITDLVSYNEYMGWYDGTADDHGDFCDERHGQIPHRALAISEYGAEGILKWHSAQPKVKDYSEEYHAIVHEKAMRDFDKREYLWATWLWNMFDFAADSRDEGGCKGRNNKGLVTYDRKTKKQAYYFYKACWSKEPFVYICGERFTKRFEDAVDIKIYSNQPAVSLWMNGEFIGKIEGESIFVFEQVALTKQFNEVIAKTDNGCEVKLTLEKVAANPEEYVFKEEKNLSGNVAQWFAGMLESGIEVKDELVVREGYLSVHDTTEELYKYPEAFEAVQEIIAKPLELGNPGSAARMSKGGPMKFIGIWHHIKKNLPDELIYILNERLNKIKR